MFRIVLIAGFVLLIGLQTAFVATALQNNLIPVVVDDTDISLQRASALIEKSHRLDEFALKQRVREVADSDGVRRVMVADYEQDPADERRRALIRQLDEMHFTFTTRVADNNSRNLALDLGSRRPVDHDMFMVLDEDGRLAATRIPELLRQMGDNFGARFSIIDEVMEQQETAVDIWNWAWGSPDERELYIVAITPLYHPEEDRVVGTVVLGHHVNDGVANRHRALLADGVEDDELNEDDLVGERLEDHVDLSTRQQTQTPELVFFRGDRFYASTLSSNQRSDLNTELFDRHAILEGDEKPAAIFDTTVDGEDHRTMVRFFPGQFETDNPAGVILTTNRDDAIAPFDAVRGDTIAVGAGAIALGIILIVAFFHLFLKPFGRLEDGVQQIIAGDKDYEFDTDKGHSVARNLAYHLNLLSAYLQDKPMPDDDPSFSGGWDTGDLQDLNSSGDEEQGSSTITGVPMGVGPVGDDSSGPDESPQPDESDEPEQPPKEPAGEPT